MAPIYDTDIAEERWSQAEWEHYELWEKVELRLRRRKWMWIGGTAAAFLLLSAVPTVMLNSPKWSSMAACRRLASEISRMKRDSAVNQSAYRVTFQAGGSLRYAVEKGEACSRADGWERVREGALVDDGRLDGFRMVAADEGAALGVPGLVDSFCYDSLSGSDLVLRGIALGGFGVRPGAPGVKAMAESDSDPGPRALSVLLLSGPSADISFE